MLLCRCILLKFYIKPQPSGNRIGAASCCILLKFYIKPQHTSHFYCFLVVVSYWNSTSNHNFASSASLLVVVVSYWNSTSNHNYNRFILSRLLLYLIEILHQTTTSLLLTPPLSRCILLKFYIKPQHPCCRSWFFRVVSYWNSTSNHNQARRMEYAERVVSYWNSTSNHNAEPIIFNLAHVVSYWNSTSNHNRLASRRSRRLVVSYWNSTSNHNVETTFSQEPCVVSYWNSTSNHNSKFRCRLKTSVVSYWNSTSNHNPSLSLTLLFWLYLIEILHQTTTRASA